MGLLWILPSSWLQAHCFNPLFCTALSHSFHSNKVYSNYYLDLKVFAVLVDFPFNFFQNHFFKSQQLH